MKDITWKKWIALTLSAALTLSTLTACGSEKDQPEETQTVQANYADMTIEELKPLLQTVDQGKLTMATSPDFAPSEF